MKNKLPILAKRFFNTQRRKRRHSRATSRLSDEVYWKISKLKSGSYYLTIPKENYIKMLQKFNSLQYRNGMFRYILLIMLLCFVNVKNEVNAQMDLALTKTLAIGQSPNVTAGETVVFTITVFNQGTVPAYNILVNDYSPNGYNYANFFTDNPLWDTQDFNGFADYTFTGPLNPGGSFTIDIELVVNNPFDPATMILTNCAEISEVYDVNGVEVVVDADSNPDADSTNDVFVDNVINNAGSDEDDHDCEEVNYVTPSTDLELTKTVTTFPFGGTTQIIYTITVTNTGGQTATGVQITDVIPAGLSGVGNINSSGVYNGTQIDWSNLSIGAGQSISLTFTCVPNNPGTYTNTAEVTASNQGDSDSSPNNQDPSEDDQDSVSVTIPGNCTPDGCTDINACNYDVSATCDDGTCTYGNTSCPQPCNVIFGCTNATACNYNPAATCNNGTCNLPDGCTDITACNYDASASCDDGSCNYGITSCPQPCNVTFGCTNTAACNYNPAATCDNGSCNSPDGCTDATACNYDSSASCDDGTCTYGNTACPQPCNVIFGCTDANACNYNALATCNNNSCNYGDITCPQPCNVIFGCTNANACNYNASATCDNGSCNSPDGCTDATACNYDTNAICDDGSCNYGVTSCPQPCNVIYGCTDANACNYNASATCNNSSCNYGIISCPQPCNVVYGCTDSQACNYNPNATCDNNTCDSTSCEGCTDATACNYSPNATSDDGSCEFASCKGCTNANACNYDASATIDDGSCDYGNTNCPDPCNVIFGCTDATACNYDVNANCDNSSCDFTSCVSGDCQLSIPMPYAGWHLISSYCEPLNDSIEAVFAPIVSDIIQVKNLTGQVYVPSFNNFNNGLDFWEMENGYLVKTFSSTTLNIIGGQEVDLNVDNIPLYTGWNLIAYWLQGDSDPIDAFDNIASDVIQVKDLSGAYVPSFNNFNNMGNMNETRGYLVKMNAANTLFYDAADILPRPAPGNVIETERLEPTHFTKEIKPNPNTSTMLVINDENNDLSYGDELGVFTKDGLLVGAFIYENAMMGGLIFGDDETEEGVDGILENENYVFKVWDKTLNRERSVEMEFVQGNSSYIKDDLCVVGFKANDVAGINSIDGLAISITPNPASSHIVFDINLSKTENFTIEIYNADGKFVEAIFEGKLPTGNSNIDYDINHLPSGLYVYKISNGKEFTSDRLMIRK